MLTYHKEHVMLFLKNWISEHPVRMLFVLILAAVIVTFGMYLLAPSGSSYQRDLWNILCGLAVPTALVVFLLSAGGFDS